MSGLAATSKYGTTTDGRFGPWQVYVDKEDADKFAQANPEIECTITNPEEGQPDSVFLTVAVVHFKEGGVKVSLCAQPSDSHILPHSFDPYICICLTHPVALIALVFI